VAGGCAFSLVVVIAGAAFAGVTFYGRLQHGGFNCLPSGFPKYPGATPGAFEYELNGPTPGSSCHIVYESNDSAGAVVDFYATSLNKGDWRVQSINADGSEISFRSAKNARISGTLDVAAKDGHTEITIQLYS